MHAFFFLLVAAAGASVPRVVTPPPNGGGRRVLTEFTQNSETAPEAPADVLSGGCYVTVCEEDTALGLGLYLDCNGELIGNRPQGIPPCERFSCQVLTVRLENSEETLAAFDRFCPSVPSEDVARAIPVADECHLRSTDPNFCLSAASVAAAQCDRFGLDCPPAAPASVGMLEQAAQNCVFEACQAALGTYGEDGQPQLAPVWMDCVFNVFVFDRPAAVPDCPADYVPADPDLEYFTEWSNQTQGPPPACPPIIELPAYCVEVVQAGSMAGTATLRSELGTARTSNELRNARGALIIAVILAIAALATILVGTVVWCARRKE